LKYAKGGLHCNIVKTSLTVLHLEDNRDDGELVNRHLLRAGLECDIDRQQTRDGFLAGLERTDLDLILSDFTLPGFDGLSALALAREKRPEVPFVFVSGTIGEEKAIEALKSGATDYILKQNLARLGPAVRRAIEDVEDEQALHQAEEAMEQSEFKYRQLFDCLSEAALLVDVATGRIVDLNRQAERLFDWSRTELLGMRQQDLHINETPDEYRNRTTGWTAQERRRQWKGEILRKNGETLPVEISDAPLLLYGRRMLLGLYLEVPGRSPAEGQLASEDPRADRLL
jgi:PAS domain S-box-containing protein